jgi:hypothetical protein
MLARAGSEELHAGLLAAHLRPRRGLPHSFTHHSTIFFIPGDKRNRRCSSVRASFKRLHFQSGPDCNCRRCGFFPLNLHFSPFEENSVRGIRVVAGASSWREAWKLSDGNSPNHWRLRRGERPPLSDEGARRVIKEREQYERLLRKSKGPEASTGQKWIRRSPEEMEEFLADGKWQWRWRRRYNRIVEDAISTVRQLAQLPRESINMRQVLGFVNNPKPSVKCFPVLGAVRYQSLYISTWGPSYLKINHQRLWPRV